MLQTIAAASLAWLAASNVPGNEVDPTFAPIAAIVALSAGIGQRGRQAILMVIGVAIGVAIASLIVFAVGTGSWQIFVMMSGAMLVALVLRLGDLVAAQAGIWAILVATIPVPGLDAVLDRLVNVGIGGGIALVFSQLLFPADPVRLVSAAVRPLLDDLATALEQAARALEERDEERAAEALVRSEDLDRRGASQALRLAHETTRRSPRRRGAAGRLREFGRAIDELGTAGRDAVVLAVATTRLVRSGDGTPDGLVGVLDDLAGAVRALSEALDRGEGFDEVSEQALRATRRLRTLSLGEGMAGQLIADQVESLARDLMRASGRAEDEAAAAVARTAR
jgi:uncharacterized membrane protein YccC